MEVEGGLAADGVDGADDLAGLDLVAGGDVDAAEAAIESEIASMAHEDALVIARPTNSTKRVVA